MMQIYKYMNLESFDHFFSHIDQTNTKKNLTVPAVPDSWQAPRGGPTQTPVTQSEKKKTVSHTPWLLDIPGISLRLQS